MSGAIPAISPAALSLEEGLPMETLKSIDSIAWRRPLAGSGYRHCNRRHQVVQRGAADSDCLSTLPAWGRFPPIFTGARKLGVGDIAAVSGTLGDHGATILNLRQHWGWMASWRATCAVLTPLIQTLRRAY
ncbi:hypothetical protein KCP77_07370 [Salmonella enterica subsp. enterica]|nr:hypothetical protein KCP77_07370 [Salmonella enterica subsp. enterica]